MIIIPKLMIAYQNIPKVATTSIFQWFYECLKKNNMFVEDNREKNKFIRDYFKGDGSNAVEKEASASFLQEYPGCFSFALTRDPIRRFISMYSNRVIHHKKLEIPEVAERLKKRHLSIAPSLDQLVENLDDYRKISRDIAHHSAPMMVFLGRDLTIYNRLVDISEINMVIQEIVRHWEKAGMGEFTKNLPELGRSQTGGPKLGLEEVSEESFERLAEFYRDDYENLPTLDLTKTSQAHREARAEKKPTQNVSVTEASLEARDRIFDNETDEVTRTTGTGIALKIRKIESPLINLLRAQLKENTENNGGGATLQGVLVLSDVVVQDKFELILLDGGVEKSVTWGLPSPKVADAYPENQQAAHARFRTGPLDLWPNREPLELYLKRSSGERELVLTVALKR